MNEEIEDEHREAAADAELEVEDLKRQGDKLGEEIEDTRSDWEHKQDDSSVPGAVPGAEDEGEAEPPSE